MCGDMLSSLCLTVASAANGMSCLAVGLGFACARAVDTAASVTNECNLTGKGKRGFV